MKKLTQIITFRVEMPYSEQYTSSGRQTRTQGQVQSSLSSSSVIIMIMSILLTEKTVCCENRCFEVPLGIAISITIRDFKSVQLHHDSFL